MADEMPPRVAPAAEDATMIADAPTPPAPRPTPAGGRPVVAPLAADRYKVQITVSGATIETLRRLQDLIRHTTPDGNPAVIVDRALTLLLTHLERTNLGVTDHPRVGRPARRRSRHIPAAVRRAVWFRDKGQCTFVGAEGRCDARGFLQFHHREPYALGGQATIDLIALRCAAHNRYESEQEFAMRPHGPGSAALRA